jgi:hypothetical protein
MNFSYMVLVLVKINGNKSVAGRTRKCDDGSSLSVNS